MANTPPTGAPDTFDVLLGKLGEAIDAVAYAGEYADLATLWANVRTARAALRAEYDRVVKENFGLVAQLRSLQGIQTHQNRFANERVAKHLESEISDV